MMRGLMRTNNRNKKGSTMTEKQLIAETRNLRLDAWLRKQDFNPGFNRKLEKATEFRSKLNEWAERNDPHEVAPTFHAYPGAC